MVRVVCLLPLLVGLASNVVAQPAVLDLVASIDGVSTGQPPAVAASEGQ